MARDIRAKALQKIAALSATSSSSPVDKSDIDRLCKACPGHGNFREITINGYGLKHSKIGRVPMVCQGPCECRVLLHADPTGGSPFASSKSFSHYAKLHPWSGRTKAPRSWPSS
jgi:phosphatidylinositol 4-kinase A